MHEKLLSDFGLTCFFVFFFSKMMMVSMEPAAWWTMQHAKMLHFQKKN